jgi:hypothetical protein
MIRVPLPAGGHEPCPVGSLPAPVDPPADRDRTYALIRAPCSSVCPGPQARGLVGSRVGGAKLAQAFARPGPGARVPGILPVSAARRPCAQNASALHAGIPASCTGSDPGSLELSGAAGCSDGARPPRSRCLRVSPPAGAEPGAGGSRTPCRQPASLEGRGRRSSSLTGYRTSGPLISAAWPVPLELRSRAERCSCPSLGPRGH